MSNSEQLIGLVKTVYSENWQKDYFDLFLTDRRLVLLHKKSKIKDAKIGLVLGGLLGAVVEGMTKPSRDYGDKVTESFDELLKSDKMSFAANYSDLEYLKLNKSRWERNSIIFKFEGKIRTFYILDDERAEQLSKLFSSIATLSKKLT